MRNTIQWSIDDKSQGHALVAILYAMLPGTLNNIHEKEVATVAINRTS